MVTKSAFTQAVLADASVKRTAAKPLAIPSDTTRSSISPVRVIMAGSASMPYSSSISMSVGSGRPPATTVIMWTAAQLVLAARSVKSTEAMPLATASSVPTGSKGTISFVRFTMPMIASGLTMVITVGSSSSTDTMPAATHESLASESV